MSIETLRTINHQLRPIERKIRQILRLGKVTSVTGSTLEIQFSERETIKNAPFLSLNGLEVGPKKGDSVLVYAHDGQLANSIAIAVVAMGSEEKKEKASLKAKEIHLEADSSSILSKNLNIEAQEKIALKTNQLDIESEQVCMKAKERTLGAILKELSDAIHEITTPGFFTVTGQVTTSGPAGTWPILNGSTTAKSISIPTEGFN